MSSLFAGRSQSGPSTTTTLKENTMSKGSNPRPFEVPKEKFRDNWDQIFGKKPAKPPENPVPAK